jgi:pimeloyl-ACP methyl ester carboxylesterase
LRLGGRTTLHALGAILAAVSCAVPLIAQRAGADFDAELARLRAGRTYKPQPAGVREIVTVVNNTRLDNIVEVPEGYDPAKKWPLRVQLHGGVGRPVPTARDPLPRPLVNRIPGTAEITLHPRGWDTTQWWHAAQVENIFKLLARVKADYNVDESRTYLTGISDGGTGVYFLASRAATPWASCLPLNAHPAVLENPQTGADGELLFGNLVNCPLYLVNGGRDRLYPAASVQPYVDSMKKQGIPVVFQVYPEADHDTSWWPVERPKFEAFVAGHPRVPHPARLSWETERVDRYNRLYWLVIDRLTARGRPGHVDITRRGNAFTATTRGVQQFTLLLSADVVDVGAPVQVTVNGTRAFDGMVKKDVATLRRWADRDDDRTMLYAAELPIAIR